MITCEKTGENQYRMEGLTLADLDVFQEAICRLFNESSRNEHRNFRAQLLRINRGIEPILEEYENKKLMQYKMKL